MKLLSHVNKSASYAIQGVKDTYKEEKMFKFHFFMGLFVTILSVIFISELFVNIFIFYMWMQVLSHELMNTGVENSVDMQGTKKDNFAKRAKDSAAGGTFVINITFYALSTIAILVSIFN